MYICYKKGISRLSYIVELGSWVLQQWLYLQRGKAGSLVAAKSVKLDGLAVPIWGQKPGVSLRVTDNILEAQRKSLEKLEAATADGLL